MVLPEVISQLIQKTMIIRPLKRISPSRYTAINRCPYKVVLANSHSAPLLPYPPANHLGNVIHECIRLITCREIATVKDFEENWSRLQVQEEETLKDNGFGFYTPLNENVPGYTIKKLQVKSLLYSKNMEKPQGNFKSVSHSHILTEKWLEAQDSLIGGYADIIFNRNNYIKLSDFKSGKIIIEEGQIKEEYEDQLKLYAYLYKEVYGKYPDELSVIDLEKNEYSVAFTPKECEAIAEKSREALSQINNLIEQDKLELLAKPDMDNCKFCLYRPSCRYFWDLPLASSDSQFCDLKGNLAAVKQFQNGNLNATLQRDDEVNTIFHLNSRYLPFLTNSIGKKIAFYNLRKSEINGKYEALKTTKIYEA